MVLRSSFIRLKTNNKDSQPTRTRVPVNSFLSFLGKERSPVLPTSTYRRLLPTPLILVINFPACRHLQHLLRQEHRGGLQGSNSSPYSRAQDTPPLSSILPTPFQKQTGLWYLQLPPEHLWSTQRSSLSRAVGLHITHSSWEVSWHFGTEKFLGWGSLLSGLDQFSHFLDSYIFNRK